jgi:hypothetical protein
MEILTGLFILGLYKATEEIGEKGFDAAWEPVGEALKEHFTRWAGRDKETERQAAFARAAEVARANTLRYAADPQQAEKILDALNGERDRRGAEALAEEAAKLMLFSWSSSSGGQGGCASGRPLCLWIGRDTRD